EFSEPDFEVPPEWYEHYPETRYLMKRGLMTWSPCGVLNASCADRILCWIEALEPRLGKFNRFIDFSKLSKVELAFEDVVQIARRRCEGYAGAPVKTAILAVSPLAYGMARMY